MSQRSSRRASGAFSRPLPVGLYLALVVLASLFAVWMRDGAPWTRS